MSEPIRSLSRVRSLSKAGHRGLTTVEYAVAGAIITVAVVAAFTLLGANVTAVINALAGVIAP